jgi:NADP-dependent 3-hydroxy acid dehydrogenase YdfG
VGCDRWYGSVGITGDTSIQHEGINFYNALAARNEEALSQLAEEIRSKGGQVIYVVADVGQEEDVNHIAEVAIAEFGGFDMWVNNAGVSIFGFCREVTIPDMKRMFDITGELSMAPVQP